MGGSAGAQLVAYLAWGDDFANSKSNDPVSRESSRLKAVALRGGQSTLDMNWWVENIPGYKREFHGKGGREDLSFVERRALLNEISVINHITPDDPPTFMSYGMNPDDPIPSDPKRARGWSIHHVNFGIDMEKKLRREDVNVFLKFPQAQLPFENDVAFLIHHLKSSADLLRKHGGKNGNNWFGDDKAEKSKPLKNKVPDISIHDAATEGDIEIVKQHLAAGADVELKCVNCGGTVLGHAVSGGHIEIVELLISKGADVNAKFDDDGATPLHIAAGEGHKEIVELLVAEGADVNAKFDDGGATPLHLAAQEGHKEIVELLVAEGADGECEV